MVPSTDAQRAARMVFGAKAGDDVAETIDMQDGGSDVRRRTQSATSGPTSRTGTRCQMRGRGREDVAAVEGSCLRVSTEGGIANLANLGLFHAD